MHHSIVPVGFSLEVKRCSTCCNLYHCPLCPNFKPTKPNRLKSHLDVHLKNAVPFQNLQICRCSLLCRQEGHYHCPQCEGTLLRRNSFVDHLLRCNGLNEGRVKFNNVSVKSSPDSSELQEVRLSSSPCQEDEFAYPLYQELKPVHIPLAHCSRQDNESAHPSYQFPSSRRSEVKCPHCPLLILKKNLNVHISRKHRDTCRDVTVHSHLRSVCVDATNGISAVQRSGHGFSYPIHVQKKTWGRQQWVRCELEECWQYQLLARRSGLLFTQCHHIRSLDYCTETAAEEFLHSSILDEMIACKFLGEAKKAVCLKRRQLAQLAHTPFSVLVDLGESPNHIFVSIHEPKNLRFSRLGRALVTYNKLRNTWHCPCAKPRMSCPHKHIAKWHIFQTNRELFKTQASPLADTADFSQLQNTAGYPPTNDLKRMAKYIYDKKKIPVDLSDVTKFKAISEYPSHLSPSESTCTHCLKSPTLDHPVNITEKAKIITTLGVIEDISTYYRRCPECQMTYRYQEWQDGLHNFDDHVVLSLELCLFLRHSLQNHTSISRAINSLEGLRKVQYPARDTILHAYCHFEALMSTDYTYSCVACGYYPSVVVMNLHKKSPFNLGLSEFKEPPINYNGEQNIVEFWDSINLEMICRGFVHSSSQNPCVVQPRYEHWAPWIGTVTRKCDTVLNTEHEKVSCPQSSSEAVHTAASEDHLFDKLMKQKMSSIRQLCKACNTDTKGSRVELILRLREEVKDRQTYNKVFQKIWGTWGGWSVISCPHGVVYSFKFNLWRESPRDFADLLLSWKHLPNVCVYDFASELATHTNLRVPSPIPFWPFEGRLAESTPESLRSAQLKKLQISLPWLSEKCENPEPNGHPLTGSSQHFLLCDTLRETNTKHPQDVLKRTELVPELRWMLNSKIVSKLFSAMQKNDYFLKNMAASTQMFAMRSIIHHRNTATNTRLLELQPLGESPLDVGHITLSALGQQ